MNKYLNLFFTMLKIGLFTFGGGYAMISLLENEFVSKKQWISDDEFNQMVIIAESTPGPIAINSATYIGYKVGKILGAVLSTIAVCIPSFFIIFIISLFTDQFLKLTIIQNFFKGIEVCVIYLIFRAGLKIFLKLEKNIINISIFSLTTVSMIILSILSISFSSIYYILISGLLGIVIFYLLPYLQRGRK